HHEDQPNSNGNRSRAHAEAVEERDSSRKSPAWPDAEEHGGKDPECEEAVEEAEAGCDLRAHGLYTFRRRARRLAVTDVVEFALQGEPVHIGERQAEEQTDPAIEEQEGIAESLLHLLVRCLHGSRIGDTPVGGNRLARPNGTNFAGGVVTHREDKIHVWGAGLGKLLPALAAQAG